VLQVRKQGWAIPDDAMHAIFAELAAAPPSRETHRRTPRTVLPVPCAPEGPSNEAAAPTPVQEVLPTVRCVLTPMEEVRGVRCALTPQAGPGVQQASAF
jgi:hypothetical protein